VAAREKWGAAGGSTRLLPLPQVIDVLVAVIHAPTADARRIAATLQARGEQVTAEQVEEVFARYNVKKKTARSRSRRWRR